MPVVALGVVWGGIWLATVVQAFTETPAAGSTSVLRSNGAPAAGPTSGLRSPEAGRREDLALL